MTETAHHPMLAEDRVARWLGVTLEAAEKDHARIRMTLTEDQHNGFGLAHGGAVFAFADTCFALTCNDPASDGSTLTVASGVDVNFLAATRAGQTLVAEGRLVAAAGRSAVYDITVTTDDDGGPRTEEFEHVAGVVIREGTTNILRHSDARRVDISLAPGHVVMSNDGVLAVPAEDHRGGLENLRSRLAGVGGRLDVSCVDGRFTLGARWEADEEESV